MTNFRIDHRSKVVQTQGLMLLYTYNQAIVVD